MMINKDKIKGFLAGLSVAVILCSTTVFADSVSKTVTAVYNNIKIMIDGKEITPKDQNGNTVEPFIIDGTTYLPVRAVASALGEEVFWDGENNTVYIGDKPAVKSAFAVNIATFKPFTHATLMTVDGTPVAGGAFNFYMAQNASDSYMQYNCDNYSPDASLQSLTINSVPAAKFLADNIGNSLKTIYAVANETEKNGFSKKTETINEVNSQWEAYKGQFASEEELKAFAESNAISPEHLEALAKNSFLTSLYANSIYEEKLKGNIDTKEFEENYRKNYITAKHILVEDEGTAKKIISSLNKGGNFDALMKEYNTDPGATAEGYTFTRGEMVAPFETAAFELKENTYTKTAVKTDYGYHIIYRCTFNEDALKEAVDSYKASLAMQEANAYLDTLTNKAVVSYSAEYEKYITTIK